MTSHYFPQSSKTASSPSPGNTGQSWDRLLREADLLTAQRTAEKRLRDYFSLLPGRKPKMGQAGALHLAAHQNLKRGRILAGGNKSGKSTWGAVESILWLQGIHPWRLTPKPPAYLRIVTPDLPMPRKKHPMRDMLQFWTPPMWLRGHNWNEAWGDNARTLWFENGSNLEFVSAGQEAVVHAGAWAVAGVWFDEAVPEYHFRENLIRLDQEYAAWWFTFCPANCASVPWIFERWFSPKSEPDDSIQIFKFSSEDNAHNLPENQVEDMIAGMLPHEIASRIRGEFSDQGGRVYDFPLGTTDYDVTRLAKDTQKWGNPLWGETESPSGTT